MEQVAYFHRNGAKYVEHPRFGPLSVEDWKDHEGEGEGEEEEELQQQQAWRKVAFLVMLRPL
jgi:hypothetical protein